MQISVVILTLFLLSLFALGGYILGYWLMRRKLSQSLKTLRRRIKALQGEMKSLGEARDEVQQYAEEPYLTNLMDIDHELDGLRQTLKDLQSLYVEVRSRFPMDSRFRVREIFQAVELYRALRSCGKIDAECSTFEGNLSRQKERFDQIQEFPWSVALQARELVEYCQQAQKLCLEVGALGLVGEEFANVREEIRLIQEESGKLPVYFLSEGRENLLRMASKDDVHWAYELTHRALPQIVGIMQKIDKWKNQLLTCDVEMELASKEVENFAEGLKYFPESVDVNEMKKQLEVYYQKLDDFNHSRKEIEAASLIPLSSAWSHLVQEVKNHNNSLRVTRRIYSSFEATLSQLEKIISQIDEIFSRTENKSTYSLVWDESRPRVERQILIYEKLKQTPKPYPISAISEMNQQALNAYQLLKKIEARICEIEGVYTKFLKIVNAKEFQDAESVFRQAQELWGKVQVYNPRNWPKKEWVVSLGDDVAVLETQFRRQKEQLSPGEILESRITELVSEVERLSGGLMSFIERVEVIDNVFKAIRSTEAECWELLKQSRAQFTQIIPLVKSNPLLSERCEKEIVHLDRQFDMREEELNARGKDVVSKKIHRIQQLIGEVEETGNRWLQIVESDCWKLWNELSQKVLKLEQVAPFTDAIIKQAGVVLGQRYQIFEQSKTAHARYSIDQLVGAMKRIVDYWNECHSVLLQLSEQVEKPVLMVYEECLRSRQEAQRRFADIQTILPSQRQWPPSSVVVGLERNEMQQLEEKWKNIQVQPNSSIQVVRMMGELQGGYRTILEKLIQYEQWAVQEQERVQHLEAEIYRLDRLWEVQENRYRHFPEISGQIRDMRIKYQTEIHSIHQYWISNVSKRTAAVDYDVVLKRLIEVSRNLANAKIPYVNEDGKTEAIDINGHVITRQFG